MNGEKKDFETILSERQQEAVVDAVESDFVVKPSFNRRFSRAADLVLTHWSNAERSGDYREIAKATGASSESQLSRAVRVNNVNRIHAGIEAGLRLDQHDFEYLSIVITRMTQYNRMFLRAHYVKRPKVVADLYEKIKQIDEESDKDYRQRVMAEYYKLVGLSKPTYDRYLRDARHEFMVRGGLQL